VQLSGSFPRQQTTAEGKPSSPLLKDPVKHPGRLTRFAQATLKTVATLLILALALLAALIIWDFYVASPWTRDGSVPVNGYVTNLLLRLGDYAHAGVTNISVIDADSYWVDGYFEETKMAHICIGDRAEVKLMGYRDPIVGQVQTVTRGISVSNAAPSTQGLPNVDPVYTWVRLAQRVPVRIRITHVPAGVPLVSGMTVTVTIRGVEAREGSDWLRQRFASLGERLNNVVYGPQPSANCVPRIGNESGATVALPTPQPSAPLTPEDINPGLASGLTNKPRIPRVP
jgi:hypothetical protein